MIHNMVDYLKFRKFRLIPEILLIGALFVCAYFVSGMWFETNDDVFIAMILNGTLTGEPSAYALHIGTVISFICSALYSVLPMIPWYGMFLIAVLLFSSVVIVDSLCSRADNFRQWWLSFLTGVLLVFSNWYIISRIQYTSATAYLAIAGYFALFVHKNKRTRMILFTICELIAVSIREDGMYMIQPMGMAVFAGLCFENVKEKKFWKKVGETVKRVLPVLTIALCCIAISKCAYDLQYRSNEWQEFCKYNSSREDTFDFYSAPPYEEVAEIFESRGIDKTKFMAYLYYEAFDWDAQDGSIRELAEYTKEHYPLSVNIKDIILTVFKTSVNDYGKAFACTIWAVWLALLIWIFVFKKYEAILPTLGYLICKYLIWGILVWEKRSIRRVMHPLFFCEIAFIVAIIICNTDFAKDIKESGVVKKMFSLAAAVAVLASLTVCGAYYVWYVAEIKSAYEIMTNMENEVDEYCNAHPENRYDVSTTIFRYIPKTPFDTYRREKNSFYSSGWFAGSPLYAKYVTEYLSDAKSLYYIYISEDKERDEWIFKYLTETVGPDYEWADSIDSATGGKFDIYRFDYK